MITSIINYLIEGIGTMAVAITQIMFGKTLTELSETDSVMAGISAMDGVLTVVGATIVISSLYLRLAASLASPLTGAETEHPLRIAIRGVLSGMLVAASATLVSSFISLTDSLFARITSYSIGESGTSGPDITSVISSVFLDLIPAAGASSLLLHLLFTVVMAWNVIKISLITFEHYILLIVCAHLSPVMAGFISSPKTSDIAKGYARSLLGQCLCLVLTGWGVRAFSLSLSLHFISMKENFTLAEMLFLVLFTNVIASMDTILSKLGFNTSPTTENIKGGISKVTGALEAAGMREITHFASGKDKRNVVDAESSSFIQKTISSVCAASPVSKAATSDFANARPSLQKVMSFASGMGVNGAAEIAAQEKRDADRRWNLSGINIALESKSVPSLTDAKVANEALFPDGDIRFTEHVTPFNSDYSLPHIFTPVPMEEENPVQYCTFEQKSGNIYRQSEGLAAKSREDAAEAIAHLPGRYSLSGVSRDLPGTKYKLYSIERKNEKTG